MIMNDDCDVVDIYLEKLPIKVGQVDKDFRVLMLIYDHEY